MTRNEACKLYIETYRNTYSKEPDLFITEYWTTLDFLDEVEWMRAREVDNYEI